MRSCGRSANHISLIRHTRPGESRRRTGENRPRIAQVDSAGEQAQEDALNQLAALREKLDQVRQAELQSYADSLTAAITTRLGELNLNVPIHVTITPAPNDADLRYGTTPLPGESDSPIDEAVASAIANTAGPATLPGTPLERAQRVD